jgi:hypothetical protein
MLCEYLARARLLMEKKDNLNIFHYELVDSIAMTNKLTVSLDKKE